MTMRWKINRLKAKNSGGRGPYPTKISIVGYSSVPNRRTGWNKHIGRKKSQDLINLLDGIHMLVEKFWKI